jgi:RHS repeat-associated protein
MVMPRRFVRCIRRSGLLRSLTPILLSVVAAGCDPDEPPGGAGGSAGSSGKGGSTGGGGSAGKVGGAGENEPGAGGSSGSVGEGGSSVGGTLGGEGGEAGSTVAGGSAGSPEAGGASGAGATGEGGGGFGGESGETGLPCGMECAPRDDCDASAFCDVGSGQCVFELKPECVELPPLVPSPIDPTVPQNLFEQTRFLFEGANPIQRNVAPDAIEAERVAILNGNVRLRDGGALSRVRVSVKDHPEYGHTLTRHDGEFDLAVNGGGTFTLEYGRPDFLPAQRTVNAPWRDYARVDDVVLLPLDGPTTSVSASALSVTVHASEEEADEDGRRRMTLLFMPGTTATLELDACQEQVLQSYNVQAIEYTVGEAGPAAMPAPLPPTSAYTYAVELIVREAFEADAKSVRFSQPVVGYVENFLEMPVGLVVPYGYYAREKAQWIPAESGRIVRVAAVDDGIAELEVDESGLPASTEQLAELGISEEELRTLAERYAVGSTLTRLRFEHFTPCDPNYAFLLTGSQAPSSNTPNDNDETDACERDGSIIECQNQVLGENLAIVGTPLRLSYRSNRVPGFHPTLMLRVTADAESATYRERRIQVRSGGNERSYVLPQRALSAEPVELDTWDTADRFGRAVQGALPYEIVSTARSVGEYCRAPAFAQSAADCVDGGLTRLRGEVPVTRRLGYGFRSGWDARGFGIGGWTLDIHHLYDWSSNTLLLGNGEQRTRDSLPKVLSLHSGTGDAGFSGDGASSKLAELNLSASVGDIVVAPDGGVYFGDGCRVRYVDRDGLIRTVAGTGQCPPTDFTPQPPAPIICGQPPADPLATEVALAPRGLGLGPDDALYIASANGIGNGSDVALGFIFRLDPETGTLRHIAGSSEPEGLGDGGSALVANLRPTDVAVGSDGAIYVADPGNHRIRRVGTDGSISTFAGTGESGDCTPSNPTTVSLSRPNSLAVDSNGRLLLADRGCGDALFVSPDGRIEVVATSEALGATATHVTFGVKNSPYVSAESLWDGYSGVAALLSEPPVGELTVKSVFEVLSDGRLIRVVGGGIAELAPNIPATSASLIGANTVAIAAAPDGSLLLREPGNNRILRMYTEVAGASSGNLFLPNDGGDQLFEFEPSGKHRRTIDALSRTPVYEFSYDDAGRLIGVTDADGNLTSIERATDGTPVAIESADGHRTTLTLDENGFLASVTNPAGETTSMTHDADGLLRELENGRGLVHRFEYDDGGRLLTDTDAREATQTLQREELSSGYRVTHFSPMERKTTYQVQRSPLPGGTRSFLTTTPDGSLTSSVTSDAGVTTTRMADGTTRVTVRGPDERFGMRAPITQNETITTPAGVELQSTSVRLVTLSIPEDPLSPVDSIFEETSINGDTFTSEYDAALRRYTRTSAQGRVTRETVDTAGRVVQREVTGIAPTHFSYDSRGRLSSISQGTGEAARTTSFSYDPDSGWLTQIVDPEERSTEFTSHDPIGRVLAQVLPGNRTVTFSYDPNANVTGVTPPGQPPHAFVYDANDQMSRYAPPPPEPAASGNWSTDYTYDPDRALTSVARPDGLPIGYGYDAGGRLTSITYPNPLDTELDETIAVTYEAGRPKTLTSGSGVTLGYEYDGPLVLSESWSGAIAGSLSRTYDNHFRVATEAVNGSAAVVFGYDADGLLVNAGALTLQRRADNGLLTGATLEGLNETVTYNEFGELQSFAARAPDSSDLLVVDYGTRDHLGRIVEKTETIGGVTTTYAFAYDDAGRLEAVSKDGVETASYGYDANGNRLSKEVPGADPVAATYDDQDRLASYGDETFTYTANGELRTKVTPGVGTTTYTYDVLGNLRRVVLPNGDVLDYLVDGKNRRVGKKVNGTLVQAFLYGNALSPVAELDGSGNIVSRFVYGTRINVPEYMVRDGVTYRIVTDHLGSPRLVVNAATGAIAQRIDYDEWGVVLGDTAPGFQPFGFAGGIYDRDTALVRFGARDYAAQQGLWSSRDAPQLLVQRSNLVGYAQQDPINRTDSRGRKDFYFFFEYELARWIGADFSTGLVFDFEDRRRSGCFRSSGGAVGSSDGWSIGVGYARRDIEGRSYNFDVNAPIPQFPVASGSVTLSADDQGFNSVGIGIGPTSPFGPFGAAASVTSTITCPCENALARALVDLFIRLGS